MRIFFYVVKKNKNQILLKIHSCKEHYRYTHVNNFIKKKHLVQCSLFIATNEIIDKKDSC